jgi:hypothetical protein
LTDVTVHFFPLRHSVLDALATAQSCGIGDQRLGKAGELFAAERPESD